MGYPQLRIGTRGSPMALAQTHRVSRALSIANPDLQKADAIEIDVIQTTAERVQDRQLAEIGGIGLFTTIRRATWRVRVCSVVEFTVVDVSLKKQYRTSCVATRL